MTVSRYHPLLVVLHWVLAVMVPAALTTGVLILAPMAETNPVKPGLIVHHAQIGGIIGTLMLVRLGVRLATPRPAPAVTDSGWLGALAWISHRGFYVLVFLQVGFGVWLLAEAGILGNVLRARPPALPADFAAFSAFGWHALGAALLAGLITLHLAGVAFHLFVRKDRLLSRMAWAGRARTPPRSR